MGDAKPWADTNDLEILIPMIRSFIFNMNRGILRINPGYSETFASITTLILLSIRLAPDDGSRYEVFL
jgi:hypothetical protein